MARHVRWKVFFCGTAKKNVILAVQFDFEGKFEPLDERFSPSRGSHRFGRGRKWGSGHLSGQTGFWSASSRANSKIRHLAHENRQKTGNETKFFWKMSKKKILVSIFLKMSKKKIWFRIIQIPPTRPTAPH